MVTLIRKTLGFLKRFINAFEKAFPGPTLFITFSLFAVALFIGGILLMGGMAISLLTLSGILTQSTNILLVVPASLFIHSLYAENKGNKYFDYMVAYTIALSAIDGKRDLDSLKSSDIEKFLRYFNPDKYSTTIDFKVADLDHLNYEDKDIKDFSHPGKNYFNRSGQYVKGFALPYYPDWELKKWRSEKVKARNSLNLAKQSLIAVVIIDLVSFIVGLILK